MEWVVIGTAINVLYLTFVLWSVFEVCNLEFGPFYNYPFFL